MAMNIRGIIVTGVCSLALLTSGCGTSVSGVAAKATPVTPMATVQIIQGPDGLQATIPQSWTRRVWNTGAGSNVEEGTSAGNITNTIWAVPQKVGVTKTVFQGNYIISKTFSQYFSAEIVVSNTTSNRTLAGRILKSLKLYHLKRGES